MVGVSQQQISDDLAEVKRRWRESADSALDERRAFELAKLDNLERVAWEAWEASKADSPGNPRFLAEVKRCIMARVKLLGLAAPERSEVDVKPLHRPYIEFTTEELIALGFRTPAEMNADTELQASIDRKLAAIDNPD
jgi:hypothetical protein